MKTVKNKILKMIRDVIKNKKSQTVAHLLVLNIILFLFISCTKDESQKNLDPIIGKWHLMATYKNNIAQVLSACSLQKSIEFKKTGYYEEEYFAKDTITNICKSSGTTDGKWSNDNNRYSLDPTSLFDQKQKIELKDNELKYSFEGWQFVGNNLITSQIVSVYNK